MTIENEIESPEELNFDPIPVIEPSEEFVNEQDVRRIIEESSNFRDLKKVIIDRLYPVQTNVANEGTFALTDRHPTMTLADAATNEGVFQFIYPRDLRILTIEFLWMTPAASGNLFWKASFGATAKGDASAVRETGATLVATATDGADILNVTRIDGVGGVVLSTLRQDDVVGIRLERQGGNASDTLNDGVDLYGIKITYI